MKPGVLLFFASLLITACRSGAGEGKGEVLAKVNDTYLYEQDLKSAMPKGLTADDSAYFRENFILSWVKEELMYQQAEKVLSSGEKNKDKELAQYYRSLLRQELLKKEMRHNVDSNVTEKEIQTYYLENRKNFELKRNIIKFLYVKVQRNAPSLESVREWMHVHDRPSMEELTRYSREYAENYNLDTTQWFYFDDITKEVPIIENYNPEHFVKNNNYVEIQDAANLYFINVIDQRIKDDISPLKMVRGRIRNIILNIRQVKEIQKFENTLLKESASQGRFEIYSK